MRFALGRRGRSGRAALVMAVMASLVLSLVATCPCPAAAATAEDPHACCAEDGPVIGPSECCPGAESAASVSPPAAPPSTSEYAPALTSESHVPLSPPFAPAVSAAVVAAPPHILRV